MHTPESPVVSIGRRDWSYRRRGEIDKARHKERVKEAIKKDDLPTIISDGNIITADPKSKKPVKVPLRSVELPHIRHKDGKEGVGAGNDDGQVGDLIGVEPGDGSGKGPGAGDKPGVEYYEEEFTVEELQQMVFADLGLPNLQPRKKQEITSDVFIFDDVRKKRTPNNLDLDRTIYANIQRNAEERGKAMIADISPDDFRVKTWREDIKEENSAVVIAMADVSGSMGEFEKYITRAFCWWTVGFLRHKYPKVNIAFIAHHTEAYEVTEEQFFKRGESGGTKCSSANELALNMINSRYSPEQYNIYPLHFSDGDNWGQDDERCVSLVNEMLDRNINQYAYVQIGADRMSSLRKAYEEKVKDERMKVVVIGKKEDMFPGLKTIFPQDTKA